MHIKRVRVQTVPITFADRLGVPAFSNVDTRGDLMLLWLLPSFILILNRVVG